MSEFVSSVTIPLREYDALCKVQESIKNKDVYLKYSSYSGYNYVTNNKDEWMADIIKQLLTLQEECQNKRYQIIDLESVIRKYEDKYGKLK